MVNFDKHHHPPPLLSLRHFMISSLLCRVRLRLCARSLIQNDIQREAEEIAIVRSVKLVNGLVGLMIPSRILKGRGQVRLGIISRFFAGDAMCRRVWTTMDDSWSAAASLVNEA